MQRTGVESCRFSEPEEILGAMPGVCFRVVPMCAGPFEVSLTNLHLGDVTLQIGNSTPLMGFARTAPETAVVQLPLENTESLVLNGLTARPRIVGTYGGGAELQRANPKSSRHAAFILPFESVEALLEPPATSKLFLPGSQALLQASPQVWERTAAIIRAAEETAVAVAETVDAEQPRRALREALLHSVHELLSEAEGAAEIRIPRSSGARRRIVVAADEYLHAHRDRPIYTDELCAALGVSASSLAEAFRAVFVISPHRFLKLRRLSMVRAVLRSREGPAPLVKSVALSHGFWHLGQFAHDYRTNFGESPSETLVRARGWTATEVPACPER